tara:strand:- start:1950 stop:2948 length:999 start_codon:yes stop_codon:yes gene_type:complete
MCRSLNKILFLSLFFSLAILNYAKTETLDIKEILEIIQKDLRTLERAVYSESFSETSNNTSKKTSSSEDSEEALTRHLLKLSEIEKQIQVLTNRYEEINFKLDKISSRLSKVQADNQLRFNQLENSASISKDQNNIVSIPKSDINNNDKILPGSSKPQDLGSVSYKDMTSKSDKQTIQSVDSTKTVVTEIFESEEKILPNGTPEEKYEFAMSFLKVGDYNMSERAFREFIETNPDHKLSGNAQYWYAETFRIRQLYTDAASAYLEGYQKYPKSEKAPINLLKLGVSLVQIGEKDQGCLMIAGVKKQYPNATQSVLQKAKYEEKKFECKKDNS